jgi:hypothetical protein
MLKNDDGLEIGRIHGKEDTRYVFERGEDWDETLNA